MKVKKAITKIEKAQQLLATVLEKFEESPGHVKELLRNASAAVEKVASALSESDAPAESKPSPKEPKKDSRVRNRSKRDVKSA